MCFASSADLLAMKNFIFKFFVAGAVLAVMAGCAQTKKPLPQARAMPTGLRFDQVGRVTLFTGQPCTPQIMFAFHGEGSTMWLGAPMAETKKLTEAADKNRRVHILGKWRPGGQSNCSYVEVTSVELTR